MTHEIAESVLIRFSTYLFEGNQEQAREMVGVYGPNMKIIIVTVMFT